VKAIDIKIVEISLLSHISKGLYIRNAVE